MQRRCHRWCTHKSSLVWCTFGRACVSLGSMAGRTLHNTLRGKRKRRCDGAPNCALLEADEGVVGPARPGKDCVRLASRAALLAAAHARSMGNYGEANFALMKAHFPVRPRPQGPRQTSGVAKVVFCISLMESLMTVSAQLVCVGRRMSHMLCVCIPPLEWRLFHTQTHESFPFYHCSCIAWGLLT